MRCIRAARPKESPSDLANGAYKVLVVLDVLAEALHDALQLAHPALEVVKRAFDIGYLFQLSAMMGWSSLPWSHTLPQPILVLMGKDDPPAPLVKGRTLARLIRNARLQFIGAENGNSSIASRDTHATGVGIGLRSLEVHRLGRFDDREGWDDPA